MATGDKYAFAAPGTGLIAIDHNSEWLQHLNLYRTRPFDPNEIAAVAERVLKITV